MATNLNLNAVNQITKGSFLYEQNQKVNTISLILKGRVLVYNNGIKTLMGSGSFLGVSDFYQGNFVSNYIAYENLVIYVFPITSIEEIENIINVNKDYSGLMVAYLNKYLFELNKTETALRKCADSIYMFVKEKYEDYIRICRQSGFTPVSIRGISEIENYDSDNILDRNKINYYVECTKIPNDIQKDFFSYSNQVTLYHVSDQSEIIGLQNKECIQLVTFISKFFEALINKDTDCLYKTIAKLALDIASNGGRNEELLSMIDEIVEHINSTEKLFVEKSGYKLDADREKMEEIYFMLITGGKKDSVSTETQMKYTNQDAETAMNDMKDSLKQILDYSELEEGRAQEVTKLIINFNNLVDKTSTEDKIRTLRRRISEAFYEIYQKVFLKAYKDDNAGKVIDMFLKYGFMDENLLTKDQCIELYYLQDENNRKGPCKVYNIKDWLIEIYEGRKEPSKSEFDLDYAENLREIKKTQKVSEKEEKEYLTNPIRKVEYEIKNMFRYNNRLANGQISIFVPILYKENMNGSFSKTFLTTDKVNTTLIQLLEIDYSVFYREVLYYDKEKGIKKEYIMKQVFPDIILLPTVGVNSVMWQEIDGKKRDTSGRFLFPIFCESDLTDLFIKALGRFRFELCRTIQGTAWNNIKERSLTSEYVDYIQFYRKNRELTEEKREKLKLQIQKGKNNMREIFLIDYILWVKNESQGAIRLNKPVREILSTYCPFSKSIREKMMLQPLFEESMARYNREKTKKIKDYDLRIRALIKEGIEVPVEVEETQKYYNDL
ncbi:hypothetical protein EDD66_101568 [Mobilisporobacter senegalensis]|uniref:Cyclic nucleotide-binding domain-containing protein n=1 Tax=Mobilisporobacter senegalensis TaxID=1329262 RepID=A0A3N1Y3T4_9FIRM|nr:Crp/Fnr family transcriptional regulator [Mobilisporobacter senegalensis]ROR31947.1 hypothetical protein EDD66_101568 [Mobilisporobacter senegalensis]